MKHLAAIAVLLTVVSIYGCKSEEPRSQRTDLQTVLDRLHKLTNTVHRGSAISVPLTENIYRFYYHHDRWPTNKSEITRFAPKLDTYDAIQFDARETGGMKVSYSTPDTLKLTVELKQPSKPSAEEHSELLQLARDRVLRAFPDLDEASRSAVTTIAPKISFYKGREGWSFYRVSWLLPANRVVTLTGEGDFRRLEAAKTELRSMD